jgi:DNA-binding NarL/FixJ family response regulator
VSPGKKPKSTPLKTAVGCHNFLLGEGLGKILSEEDTAKVIGIFTEGRDYLEIRKADPGLLLLDFPIFCELEDLLEPEKGPKILLLTGRDFLPASEGRINQLIDKGVVGILAHFTPSSLLKKAIQSIKDGELWFDRKTMSNLAAQNSRSRRRNIHLTKAEQEIVGLLCQGFRNKEIAQKLDIAEQTVKSHCNKTYKKFGVTDRLQLVLEVHNHFPELAQVKAE